MRVIKFRGKKQGSSIWVYGDLKHDKGISSTGLYDRVTVAGYPIEDNTVGQFTRILDKNGKEIYEGDILQWIYDDVSDDSECEETYNKVAFQYGCFGQIGEVTGELLPFDGDKDFWIVAGNIHDNPELLKGGENGRE